jgi:hypothetical protein
MMLRYELLIVFVIGSLILTTVSSELVVSPKTTAVVVGARAQLNCSSINNDHPRWVWMLYRPPGRSGVVHSIDYTSPCVSTYPDTYAVDGSYQIGGSSYCHLIILSATLSDLYACADTGDTGSGGSAMLLVVDSEPRCSTDAVDNTVVHPAIVTLTCTLKFNSTTSWGVWIPSLQWSPSSPPSSGTSYPDSNTAYSSIIYFTEPSTPIPSYTCSVYYNSSVYVDIQPCTTIKVNVV